MNVLNQIWRRRDREHGVERVGLELDDEARAFLRHRVRRQRRHVEREAGHGAERFEVPGDAWHPDAAKKDQARRFAQLERRAERGRQGAGNEIDGHEPRPSFARRWRGQRNQPPADRGQALAWRQHDGLRARGHRQAAGEAVFADRQLEKLGEVIEGEHLLAVEDPGGEWAPTFGGENGVGRRRGRRLHPDRSKREQERACS